MKIAIVDDEVSFRRELIGYFKKYFSGGEVNYEIKTFADGEDFLKSDEKFDFLEVHTASCDARQTRLSS